MITQVFVNYFSDTSIVQPLDNNKTRTIWINSSRTHIESPEHVQALQISPIEQKIFQPNLVSTAQPLDQLILFTFKLKGENMEKSEKI